MNYRTPVVLAALLVALAISLHVPVAAAMMVAQASDELLSTGSIGQPAHGDKVYSTAAVRDPLAEAVKERFAQRFADLSVMAVRRTPYGLFEVQVGMEFLYTDEKVTWVVHGPLIDAMTRRDVSRERREQLGAIPFDQLPFALAIKHVTGDGSRKIAIFEDPNCRYCKQLRKMLANVDNLTIYTFLYPILSDDSKEKVRDVWCAQDPAAAWDDWMLRDKVPATAHCDTPIEQILALGQRLMVRGTPTIFFTSGVRANGVLSLDQLNAHFN